MTPLHTSLLVLLYFIILMVISYITGRKSDNENFFRGNRQSPWYIVSIGMIGASLSGVTFISVPGWVNNTQFTYLQMVGGYFLGYLIIAHVLLPVYYRLNLTSIYTYLEQRFGKRSYKTGAWLFLISRTIGASARLYLMANVLQISLFNALGIPFAITVIITIALIWLYTYRGGVKTIIWTDTLQTVFMLTSVVITIVYIAKSMNLNVSGVVELISQSELSRVFVWDDWSSKQHFLKQFISGAFITIVMTGLDQDMMQKNLSCKNLKEAQKNMKWYGFAFIPTNVLFLSLGVLLYVFAQREGLALPERSDDLFPMIVNSGALPAVVGVFFIIGLVAAAYSSADSALTSLTTSFTVDIMGSSNHGENLSKRTRILVHLTFSVLLILVILIFRALKEDSIISTVFTIAGYTYGPLLGLYAFGLFSKIKVKDYWVPWVAITAPLVTGLLDYHSVDWFGFQLGFEKLVLNGLLMFIGLLSICEYKMFNGHRLG
ncbi:sodium:solute symporter [Saccharicrinis fermentans]|uniref:Na(+)/glucose symporter n=1 Tax=Saccharicrinis fermentans DSM 9555 = JCM 21142 TaxID=869213 RepID=W7YAP5_9BACT|nr:sodium:solute symporter [Saccharicrinis fermentans]GAF01421.1 Na(+)/glucose symporter [Saccharicrinis fermentans DSM 9555 = JCM 21142]